MTDPRRAVEQLERLKQHLHAELGEQDIERLVRGGAERRQRRRVRRSLAVGLVLGAALTAAVALLLRWPAAEQASAGSPAAPGPASSAAAASARQAASAPEIIELRDRSRAIALEAGTHLALDEDAPERSRLRLERGRARFEVTRRPSRTFSVRAGSVTVSVLGTTFAVEVVADRVGVEVENGAVEVDWGVGRQRLLAGESGWFPPLVMSADSRAPGSEAAPVLDSPPVPLPRARPDGSASTSQAPGARELLAEVDAARAAGRPARAVELLHELLRDHPNDPRAPLAAFTLGRVLLNELGRPREAAAAFQQVGKLSPSGPFAEDALAREVEAWSLAGEPERARALAARYLQRYPSGRHAPRVKTLSGLK